MGPRIFIPGTHNGRYLAVSDAQPPAADGVEKVRNATRSGASVAASATFNALQAPKSHPPLPPNFSELARDLAAGSDNERCAKILSCEEFLAEPRVANAIAERLLAERDYSQTAWAALSLLLKQDNKHLLVETLLKGLHSPHCSPNLANELFAALRALARHNEVLSAIIEFLANAPWNSTARVHEYLTLIVQHIAEDGLPYAVERFGITATNERRHLLREVLRENYKDPVVISYFLSLFATHGNTSWMGEALVETLQTLTKEVPAAPVQECAWQFIDAAVDSAPSEAQTTRALAALRALHLVAYQKANTTRLIGLYLDPTTNALRDPIAALLHHAVKQNPAILTTFLELLHLEDGLQSVNPLPWQFIREEFHQPLIYTTFIRLLQNGSLPCNETLRNEVIALLRKAARDLGVRADMANVFVASAWTPEALELAWTLFHDVAHRHAVALLQQQLLQQGSPRRLLTFSDVLVLESAEPVELFLDMPDSATLFFTALFAAEEYHRRALALLPSSDVTPLRKIAERDKRSLLATIGSSSGGDKRWQVWATEAALSPEANQRLPTTRISREFHCFQCLETKQPYERAEFVSCTRDPITIAMCLSCAIPTLTQTDTSKLRGKCPCGCGAPLAIQDSVAMNLPASFVLSNARRVSLNLLSASEDIRLCDKADCVGGNIPPPGNTRGCKCAYCNDVIRVRIDPDMLRRLLYGFLNQSSPGGQFKTFSCDNCGAITEKDGGCDHMTCKCGHHWYFYKKVRPNKGPLLESGFYEGCSTTALNDLSLLEVFWLNQRAREWLANTPAHLR